MLNAVPRVTDALVKSVNQNVSEIFGNQRYIEREVGNLRAQTERFTKQTQQVCVCARAHVGGWVGGWVRVRPPPLTVSMLDSGWLASMRSTTI